MSLVKRISEHPWLSLTVSAASIISAIIAAVALLSPPRVTADGVAHGAGAMEQSDWVGTWRLQSPPNLDWTVTYRANGSYTLRLPDGPIDGFYEAANGVFSARAPSTDNQDRGTYRFLSPTRMEVTGELGVSIWDKIE